MRHPILAALGLLALLTACHPRAFQRAAVVADLQAAKNAFMGGQPLPPLSPDLDRYGIYRPALEHIYGHMTALRALNEKIAVLTPTLEHALAADQITDPSARKLNHQHLASLIQDFGEFVQQENELAGPAADGIVRSLVPGDPQFAEGVVTGMQKSRSQVQFIMDTFRLKQDYYRRIDALIGMADQSVTGMSRDRKAEFSSHEASAAYSAKVQELVAFEQDMNAKLKKVRTMGQVVRDQLGH